MKDISKLSDRPWEDLFNECCDLRLPVSRADTKETLQAHLNAAYDESLDKNKNIIDEELEEDPVYIGKYPRLKVIINKILPF
ncbi:MAG: hypothetical protein A2057_14500 [Ignavibacteria bacterium GWA2_35_9]|nr:MAG: hypothetical protein A2057_14500 [Ignavibacteria bacterium GWA2_35_9]OGU45370.1 MAG: hypothetical protein A2000_13190 [Ignavibacteria bacterium GWB2_36_8]OGU52846.1 MAG: hypothetical protein A2080_14095 [Ignavibacteria bacterium GWC2_36_12]